MLLTCSKLSDVRTVVSPMVPGTDAPHALRISEAGKLADAQARRERRVRGGHVVGFVLIRLYRLHSFGL